MMKEEASLRAVDQTAASLARNPSAGDLGSPAANQRAEPEKVVGSGLSKIAASGRKSHLWMPELALFCLVLPDSGQKCR